MGQVFGTLLCRPLFCSVPHRPEVDVGVDFPFSRGGHLAFNAMVLPRELIEERGKRRGM